MSSCNCRPHRPTLIDRSRLPAYCTSRPLQNAACGYEELNQILLSRFVWKHYVVITLLPWQSCVLGAELRCFYVTVGNLSCIVILDNGECAKTRHLQPYLLMQCSRLFVADDREVRERRCSLLCSGTCCRRPHGEWLSCSCAIVYFLIALENCMRSRAVCTLKNHWHRY